MKERVRAQRSDTGKTHKKYRDKTFEDHEFVGNIPANRRWELRNKEQHILIRKEQHYKDNLRIKFNMTHEEYLEMLYSQNDVCDICGNPETRVRGGAVMRLSVDHNHETGKVRALLCQNCNSALGYVKESIEILENMIEYLKEHN